MKIHTAHQNQGYKYFYCPSFNKSTMHLKIVALKHYFLLRHLFSNLRYYKINLYAFFTNQIAKLLQKFAIKLT